MDSNDMVYKLKDMQLALDTAIYESKGVKFDMDKTYLALFDELGELTHELKANWCWWKDTVSTVDNLKVLEELVDVWHFALSISNNINDDSDTDWALYALDNCKEWNSLKSAIHSMARDVTIKPLFNVAGLTITLGYTIEDVYNEYLNKNKINYDRLNGGY